ncbi:MAG: hypothetical protein JO260_02145 [Acidobacteria bacterium]|nr:hypothetical protein [Acidobacteriota bacterium]
MKKSPLTVWFALYMALFAGLSAFALQQPTYTWDLLGYIGSSVTGSDPQVIYYETFTAIQPIRSNKGIQLENPYRTDVAANPFHFAEQLPLYSIKPAYVALIKTLHRIGLPYPKSAVLISAASNFVLAMLLWFWLADHLEGLALFGSCSLIMLSPNLLIISRWTTPDALATFIATFGLYLILEGEKYFWGSSLLVLDVWIRTDSIVLAGIVMFALLLRGKLEFLQFASLSVLALASYFVIGHYSGDYGWTVLFHNSFLGGVTTPGETTLHVSMKMYLAQVLKGVYLLLVDSSFALYALLACLALWLRKSSTYTQMAAIVLGTRLVSYLLYPNGDARYTAVLYVMVPVALVIAVSGVMSDGLLVRASASDATPRNISNAALRQESLAAR